MSHFSHEFHKILQQIHMQRKCTEQEHISYYKDVTLLRRNVNITFAL